MPKLAIYSCALYSGFAFLFFAVAGPIYFLWLSIDSAFGGPLGLFSLVGQGPCDRIFWQMGKFTTFLIAINTKFTRLCAVSSIFCRVSATLVVLLTIIGRGRKGCFGCRWGWRNCFFLFLSFT